MKTKKLQQKINISNACMDCVCFNLNNDVDMHKLVKEITRRCHVK